MSFFFLSLGHGIGDGVFNRIPTWRGGMQGKAGRSTYLLFISGGLSALRCSVFLVYLLYFLARVWHRLAYLHYTLPLLYSTWAVFCSFLLSFQHALRLISESDCGFVRIPSPFVVSSCVFHSSCSRCRPFASSSHTSGHACSRPANRLVFAAANQPLGNFFTSATKR